MAISVTPNSGTTITAANHSDLLYSAHQQSSYVVSGFAVTDNGGLEVAIDSGTLFADGYRVISTFPSSQTLTLTDNATRYVYIDSTGAAAEDSAVNFASRCYLAKVVTSGGSISSISHEFSHTLNGASIFAVKESDETVNSSTALQADDDLIVNNMDKYSRYRWEMVLIVNSGATPDFKFDILETDFEGRFIMHGPSATAASVHAYGDDVTVTTDGTDQILHLHGVLHQANSTGADFELRWAQNTSDAGNTTVKAGSYLIMQRLYF